MKKIISFIFAASLLALSGGTARAQRFSLSTNAVDWLTLGTMNIEAEGAVARHVTLHVGAELNPWTFRFGDEDRQFEARHISYWGGARWWPWFVYSGWWLEGTARYSVYNIGGIGRTRDTEEGDAYGVGVSGGYTYMLAPNWNLDIGAGAWGGWTNYVRYACPYCGIQTDEGTKAFVLPDVRIAFMYVF